ncbi:MULTISPECIES: DUF11 domain-containing protein [unclassified Nocardiopsis]|uniref:DUF11 domain-containing protein n=1 Tax=unclassified Nocardiopsis TaxID=2649073 RepID=UPI00066E6A82|nr:MULTISPECIES: DUF11 domain-containing protein [unclassified Nocardiopsis]MBQ1084344.1 DUF11 domain-containing protein [Nocardiopsis sp. B62]
MAVPAAVSALGLAALIALPGQPVQTDDGPVPGAGSLHVTVQERSEDRLRPGDRVEYTVKVRNAGVEALPDARVVQFLPPSMRYVSGAPEGVEEGRAEWVQPLEPGERAALTVVGELTEVPEGAQQPVSTVCLRPAADASLSSCASAVHEVQRVVPMVWVVAGLLAVAAFAIAVGGYLRYRGTRGPRPEPETPSNHSPGSVPNLRTFPGRAPVYHLDAHR